jgi:predicted DNA-binding protein
MYAMKKSVFFRLTDEEFERLEVYCESTGRSKSDVLRELIRNLKIKKKPSSE